MMSKLPYYLVVYRDAGAVAAGAVDLDDGGGLAGHAGPERDDRGSLAWLAVVPWSEAIVVLIAAVVTAAPVIVLRIAVVVLTCDANAVDCITKELACERDNRIDDICTGKRWRTIRERWVQLCLKGGRRCHPHQSRLRTV